MQISILGTGNVAQTLAAALTASGHDVVFGSRSPQSKTQLPGRITTYVAAVSDAAVVINATPGAASLGTLAGIGLEALAGKVLIDPSNAVTPEYALLYPNSSLAEKIQAALPDTRVVKTLNTFSTAVMANPAALGAPTTVFLSGNDQDAKKIASELLTDIGWPAETHLDLGGVETARGPEHLFLLNVGVYGALGTSAVNVAVVH
jgi:predicted dinucleotide-binding enzyme